MTANAWLLVALPLAGAAILLLGGKRTNSWGHYFATAMSLGSFAVGALTFLEMLGQPAEERTTVLHLWDWIAVGNFQVPIAFQIDQLSIAFVLLITGVGSLIHVYSVGYMSHDKDRRKFFAYLNLFISAMLLLVLADNYFLLYVGWEGVGLAIDEEWANRIRLSPGVTTAAIDRMIAAARTAGATAAKVKAGELVNHVARQVGGKGGGRPDMAQAGGTDAST